MDEGATGLRIGTNASERRQARTDQHHASWGRLRTHRLDDSATREAETLRTVRGETYFYWSPDIDELKRRGDLYGALYLARECMLAAERDVLWVTMGPPPGWVLKVAIIERKLGNFAGEVEVLQRWLDLNAQAFDPYPPGDVEIRLSKAQSLANG